MTPPTLVPYDDADQDTTVLGVALPAEDLPAPIAAHEPPLAEELPAAPVPPKARTASAYRPTARPPVALLTVFDDGLTEGEVVRIRGDRFVIGRTVGDFLLPHDPLVGSPHAAITRETAGADTRWVVTDLDSPDGLFVRVSRLHLVDGTEFLVGKGRYRFAAGDSPALVEFLATGPAAKYDLTKPECWIGTAADCEVCRDDPFAEARHARVYRAPDGLWMVEHNKTRNGLWLRVKDLPVAGVCYFQTGEQRFRLRVGSDTRT